MTLLRAIPWWGWLVLLAALVVGVEEYRIHAAEAGKADAERAREEDQLRATAETRKQVEAVRQNAAQERSRLAAERDAARVAATKAEARVAALDAEVARTRAAGVHLVESGTVDETVAALRAAGLTSARRAR